MYLEKGIDEFECDVYKGNISGNFCLFLSEEGKKIRVNSEV